VLGLIKFLLGQKWIREEARRWAIFGMEGGSCPRFALPDLDCIYSLGPLSLSCTHPLALLSWLSLSLSPSLSLNRLARCERGAQYLLLLQWLTWGAYAYVVPCVCWLFFWPHILWLFLYFVVMRVTWLGVRLACGPSYCCSATHERSIDQHLCFSQNKSIMIS
jgi:hypothetical protein